MRELVIARAIGWVFIALGSAVWIVNAPGLAAATVALAFGAVIVKWSYGD